MEINENEEFIIKNNIVLDEKEINDFQEENNIESKSNITPDYENINSNRNPWSDLENNLKFQENLEKEENLNLKNTEQINKEKEESLNIKNIEQIDIKNQELNNDKEENQNLKNTKQSDIHNQESNIENNQILNNTSSKKPDNQNIQDKDSDSKNIKEIKYKKSIKNNQVINKVITNNLKNLNILVEEKKTKNKFNIKFLENQSNINNSQKSIYNEENIEYLLKGDYKHFEKNENFQKKFNETFHKNLLKYEKNYNYGDYLSILPNPDFKKNKNCGISLFQAINIFDRIFVNLIDSEYLNKFNKKLKKIFIKVFKSLKNYEGDIFYNEIENKEEIGIKLLKENNDKKIMYNGGYYKFIKDNWVRTEELTLDFLTLFRNTILVFYAFNGYIIRQFFTSNNKFICLVIFSKKENLKILAELYKINKTLDISVIDFFSFEPVDDKLRPIRINEILWDRKKWLLNYPEEPKENIIVNNNVNDSKLRLDIISYINNKINFRKIMNILNIPWSKDEIYTEIKGTIYNFKIINFKVWLNYWEYLKNLHYYIDYIYKYYNEINRKLNIVNNFLNKNSKKINRKLLKNKKRKLIKTMLNKFTYSIINSINETNEKIFDDFKLKNIWSLLNIRPYEPNIDFFNISRRKKTRIKSYYNFIWKLNDINNKGDKNLFSEIEKIKLIEWHINLFFNNDQFSIIIKKLSSFLDYSSEINFFDDSFFPLHNYLKLENDNYSKIFLELINYKREVAGLLKKDIYIINKNEKKNYDEIKTLMNEVNRSFNVKKNLEDTNRKSLIRQISHLNSELDCKIKQLNNDNINIIKKEYKKNKFNLNKPFWPVNDQFKYKFFLPWKVPILTLREYFGEKIAIYYKFLSYYATSWYPMIILSFIFIILRSINTNIQNRVISILLIIFSFIILFWNIFIISYWYRIEKYFALQFGQQDKEEVVTKLRYNFESSYERNLHNDIINDTKIFKKKLKLKQVLSIFIILILSFVSCLISYYIINFKINVFSDNSQFTLNNFFSLGGYTILINIMQYIIIKIMDKIVFFLCKILVTFNNHKFIYKHENNYIILTSIFLMINNSFPMLYPLFYKSLFDEDNCIQNDCYIETENYLFYWCIFEFTINIIYFIYQKIYHKVLKKKIDKYFDSSKDVQNINKIKKSYTKNFKVDNIKKHDFEPYSKINFLIEKQISKIPTESSYNIDNILIDYLEVIRLILIICLFGVILPIIFLLSFIIIVLEIYNDKFVLLSLLRRANPNGTSDIGLWNEILYFISLASILFNTFYITIYYLHDISTNSKFIIYIIIVSIFYIINSNIFEYFKQDDNNLIWLKKRQDFIKDLIYKNINLKKNLSVNKPFKMKFNNKISNNRSYKLN